MVTKPHYSDIFICISGDTAMLSQIAALPLMVVTCAQHPGTRA